MNKILYIIGFSGTGKSAASKLAAEALGWKLFDMDQIIEEEIGKPISQIFEQNGEEWFRDKESELLLKLSKENNCIISTGGGLPVKGSNFDIMNNSGYVLTLDASIDIIVKRLKNKSSEGENEKSLRPNQMDEFIGQKEIVDSLKLYIEAANKRGESLDHVLFFGPPGLGKTTLSIIIARELSVNIKQTSGPVLDRAGDLAGILTSLEAKDVFFIDEIHRLNAIVEEYLYSAMEDYRIEIMIDKGPSARSVQLNVEPFTLVGATTRLGSLTSPLRDRFGVILRFDYYETEDLYEIIKRSAEILEVQIDEDGALELAGRSRGTPRIANRILRRTRDYAEVKANGKINALVAKDSLSSLGIDEYGLDTMDRMILETLIDKFNGGPVGLNSLAVAVSEDVSTIEDVYEPYLIKEGFIQRTSRGRIAQEKSYKHLGKTITKKQQRLFE